MSETAAPRGCTAKRSRKMLLSTKVLQRKGSKTVLVRDWRVVNIPEEDTSQTDILALYRGVCDHTYDPLEPYTPSANEKDVPLRALIGKTQNGNDFQDIPLNVNVRDAVALFGVYIKFILCVDGQDSATQQLDVTDSDRNAFQVLCVKHVL